VHALAARTDSSARRALTLPKRLPSDSCIMDEPTHVNESTFWDQVADWILDSHEPDAPDAADGGLTDADIEAMLRELRDDLDAP
jgi:hypothetical protein